MNPICAIKLIKIMRSQPQLGGDPHQRVLPEDYLSASGESLAFIILQAWILAYFFSYDNILSNPLKDRFGYNNVCVAWDVPPALYTSAFLFSLPVYCTVRYVLLDVERMALDTFHQRMTQETRFYFGINVRWKYVVPAADFRRHSRRSSHRSRSSVLSIHLLSLAGHCRSVH